MGKKSGKWGKLVQDLNHQPSKTFPFCRELRWFSFKAIHKFAGLGFPAVVSLRMFFALFRPFSAYWTSTLLSFFPSYLSLLFLFSLLLALCSFRLVIIYNKYFLSFISCFLLSFNYIWFLLVSCLQSSLPFAVIDSVHLKSFTLFV